MTNLRGKVALITGAARGQGRSHAIRLAEAGADIVAIDIVAPIATAYYPPAVPADLAHTAKLAEAEGVAVLAAEADVRDQAALDRVVARALDAFGHIDIVVANAGTAAHAPAWELSEDQWQNVVEVNLTGVWRTVRACVPSMIALPADPLGVALLPIGRGRSAARQAGQPAPDAPVAVAQMCNCEYRGGQRLRPVLHRRISVSASHLVRTASDKAAWADRYSRLRWLVYRQLTRPELRDGTEVMASIFGDA
jgi:NAD(P)-dependent dehydrogenase (short-subunit alcohol dehydrogenase family)